MPETFALRNPDIGWELGCLNSGSQVIIAKWCQSLENDTMGWELIKMRQRLLTIVSYCYANTAELGQARVHN